MSRLRASTNGWRCSWKKWKPWRIRRAAPDTLEALNRDWRAARDVFLGRLHREMTDEQFFALHRELFWPLRCRALRLLRPIHAVSLLVVWHTQMLRAVSTIEPEDNPNEPVSPRILEQIGA